MALMQLFERNFIHLSAAIFARSLRQRWAAASIRSSTILEDWDFFLTLAQRTRFHFVPRHTFRLERRCR